MTAHTFRPKGPTQANTGFVPLAGLIPVTGAFQRRMPADLARPLHAEPEPVPTPTLTPEVTVPVTVKHAPSLTQRDLERAFQDGFAQGQAERDAALAQRIAALDATARVLENALAAISPALEVEIDALTQKLDKMVRDLAAQRAGMAIDADPSGFGQRIERLALRVSENLTGLRVVLHPTDLAALHAARDANDVPHLARVLACDLRADPSIARGDVRVQGNGLALDDLIEGRT